jgi:hypothetical protein
MRIRAFLFVAMACSASAGIAIQACGGTSEVTGTATDSGVVEAAAETGPKDAGQDVKDSAPPCDTTADPTAKIPDASMADGATTTGICVGCAKTKCAKEFNDCKADCPCQKVACDALDCYFKNPSNPLVCAGNFSSVPAKTQSIGLALFGCLREDCNSECAADQFDPDGGDGGDGG